MATIRQKTAFAAAADFRYAREQGIDLSWDNYERMLPQDGFARLGLSCADCLMGPCRINPFDRGSEKTVCGLDRAGLVYRSFMRFLGAQPHETDDYLASIIGAAAARCGEPVKTSDGSTLVGPGVLKKDKVNIICEGVDFDRLAEIERAAVDHSAIAEKAGASGFEFSLIGACCSRRNTAGGCAGAEFAVLTGLADAYLIGPGAAGAGRNAASAFHTAVMCPGMDAAAILSRAAEAYKKRDAAKIRPAAEPAELRMYSLDSLDGIAGRYEKIAVFAGDANIKRTVGAAALSAIDRLASHGVACFTFGNVAAEAAALTDGVYACGANVHDVLKHEAIAKKLCVVCMPELAFAQSVAEAIYMGSQGAGVITCTELPIEGCPELADSMHKLVGYCAPESFADRALELTGKGDA